MEQKQMKKIGIIGAMQLEVETLKSKMNVVKTTKKAIKQAKDTLEQISKDEHEQELARLRKKYIMDQNAIQEYGYCRGIEEGVEIGKRDGIKIGKYESMKDTAKKMLAKKMPVDVIIEITGLSREEIEKL